MPTGWIPFKGSSPDMFLGTLVSVESGTEGRKLVFMAGSECREVVLKDSYLPSDQYIPGEQCIVLSGKRGDALISIHRFPDSKLLWPVAGGSLA
jgi:hypothetical protein